MDDSTINDNTATSTITAWIESRPSLRGLTNYPNMKKQIIQRTKFLDDIYNKVSMKARRECFIHGIFSVDDIAICEVCYSERVMLLSGGGFSTTCSKTCSSVLSVKKGERKNLEKRGVRHHSQSSEVRDKTARTNLEKYGHVCSLQGEDALKKTYQTNIEKFGSSHHMKNSDVAYKVTNKAKNHSNSILNPEYFENRRTKDQIRGYSSYVPDTNAYTILNDRDMLSSLVQDKPIKEAAMEIGVDKKTIANYIIHHGIDRDSSLFSNRSYLECDIERFIKSIYYGTIMSSDKTLGIEVDIMLHDKKIGIEVDGLYWHSDLFKNKNYHLNKTNVCESNGYRLIHIFEDEWIYRKEQVKEKIRSILLPSTTRVFARHTYVTQELSSDAREFLESHHIQGSTRGFEYYGLRTKNDNELVAVMVFSHTRSGVELTRFASSKQVVGGFSKLVSAFWRAYPDTESIVSFADRRWSQGRVYAHNGFIEEKVLSPDYSYIQGDKRFHKSSFSKSKQQKKLENFDPSATEKENMENHGMYRIYDCGLLKYRMRNPIK